MILRVYAMWNQSKRIFYFLLFIYVPQVIISFVFQGVYVNPNTYFSGMSQAGLQVKLRSHILLLVPAIVVQIADVSSCNMFFNVFPSQLLWDIIALRLMLGVTLLILAVTSTLRQLLVMYNATKQWQPNRYMEQFTKDGILYFVAYVFPCRLLSVNSDSPARLTCKKLTTLNF